MIEYETAQCYLVWFTLVCCLGFLIGAIVHWRRPKG